jgi:CRP/FNR family cyclic AMP-dependent transcriptional regulator
VVNSPNAGVSLTILRAMPIFETLNDEDLKPLTRVAMLRSIPRHTVVLHAGDRTDAIYFVLSGALKVQISDEEGREVILSMLGPGELFGDMGALDAHPRSATVLAVESSEVVMIGKLDFKQCLMDNPDVSLFIMRNLTRRLRLADRNIESLALLDVYGRVARLLLEAAEIVDGRKVVTHKLTKQDIAKMIGASREMVSRVMRDLTTQGLIQEHDGQLILVDLDAFKRHGDGAAAT